MTFYPDQGSVRIDLFGGFLVSADGADISPVSAKACGLISLLATHSNMKRSRVWLQDKLWSDRGRKQGAGSLRQALVQIKQAFGDHKDVLQSNRRDVWLVKEQINLAPARVDEEFLQGIEVRDEEFEDWLRQQRQANRVPSMSCAPDTISEKVFGKELSVLIVHENLQSSELGLIETLFGDAFSKCLSETHPVSIYRNSMTGSPDLKVQLTAFKHQEKHVGLRASIETPNNLVVWSNWCVAKALGALPIENYQFLALANQTSVQVGQWFATQTNLSFEERSGSLACLKGIREMYRFDADSLRRADAMFSEAYGIDPKGRYLAWRANLRVIEHVERLVRTPDESREEGMELSRRALEEEHDNSVVLALAADANLVFRRDVQVCDDLSKQSISINSASPLGWWSQATAYLYGKKYVEADALARKARALAGNTTHRFWWDFQCALTAAANGKMDTAIRRAEVSAGSSPNFKAPLRYLTALYAMNGNMRKAQTTATRLKSIEPDFSGDRMANDAEYPVGLMRENSFLDSDRIRDLG